MAWLIALAVALLLLAIAGLVVGLIASWLEGAAE